LDAVTDRLPASWPLSRAFSLLEVMIATGIFFVAIFAILGLVYTNLRFARLIQAQHPNATMVAADVYYQTNQWQEGPDSGDFGELFPGNSWQSETVEMLTNGFYKVDFIIVHSNGAIETNLSAFYWRQGSATGGANLPTPGGARR
jgi:Tfp pilus assembly protein PilV